MANIYVSSGTSFSATISITYPAGSTCTVSNYKKTWTAPNTSGSWTFKAHEVGVYTVKSVSGSKSKEKEVLITVEGQVETVELTYELYIFKAGQGAVVPLSPLTDTNGRVTIGNDKITISKTSQYSCGATVYTTDSVNLSSYHTLHADVALTPLSNTYRCYLYVSESAPGGWPGTVSGLAVTEITASSSRVSLDISSVNGGYVALGNYGYGSVTNIWAE
nr:MAG TPA: hypothetical protein [Caudoviricetes sp.]